jgi:hypothetical protein
MCFLQIFNCISINRKASGKQLGEPLRIFYEGSGAIFNYLRTDIDFVQFFLEHKGSKCSFSD